MAAKERKIPFTLVRLGRFFKILLRNSKGIFGLVLIVIFAAMSITPNLFTPYDPLKSEGLAGSFSAPVWLRYLPPFLGGQPDLTQNVVVVKDPGFINNNSLNQWTLVNDNPGNISVQWDPGPPDKPPENPGCVKIQFTRDKTGATFKNLHVVIYKDFEFPYTGPPKRFAGSLSFLVNGTAVKTVVQEKFVNKSTTPWTIIKYNSTHYYLDATFTFQVFIERVEIKKWDLWPTKGFEPTSGMTGGTVKETVVNWTSSSAAFPINADATCITTRIRNPIPTIFNTTMLPGTYRWGIDITFQDTKPSKNVSTTFYIDDFGFSLQGTSFGLLGTDMYGRDLFTQLVYGARLSLYVGLLASILSVVIGLIVGLLAGYLGKVADEIIMRITDMLLVIPMLPLLIVLVAVLGPALENLIILLGLLGWMSFARLVRSQVLSLKERPYIEAAKAVGAGKVHILSRHILPNVMPLVYVSLATTVPAAIVTEAALSFLGFIDPFRMSWGRMLSDAQRESMWGNWWWVVPPGLCIALLAMAFILLGYALDEVLNPRLRVRR